MSILDDKFLRDRGMSPFVPVQKNYIGVKHRVNMDLDFQLEHLVALMPRLIRYTPCVNWDINDEVSACPKG